MMCHVQGIEGKRESTRTRRTGKGLPVARSERNLGLTAQALLLETTRILLSNLDIRSLLSAISPRDHHVVPQPESGAGWG